MAIVALSYARPVNAPAQQKSPSAQCPATRAQPRERRAFALFSNFLSPCLQRLTPGQASKLLTQHATSKYIRSLAGPSTVREFHCSGQQVFGAGGQGQTNRSVRVIQTLGSTPRHLRFPAWKGIRPPFGGLSCFTARRPAGRQVLRGLPSVAVHEPPSPANPQPVPGPNLAPTSMRIDQRVGAATVRERFPTEGPSPGAHLANAGPPQGQPRPRAGPAPR